MIQKTADRPAFDLDEWLVSALIDACSVYGDPCELVDQMRLEKAAETNDEIEHLAREIVRHGVARGWLEVVEITLESFDEKPGELAEVRTLTPDEADAAIESTPMWDRGSRCKSRYLSLSCTNAGESHLDSIETEYE